MQQEEIQRKPVLGDLITLATQWFHAQPGYLRFLIAFIGWPVTLLVLAFRISKKWPRRFAVFILIEAYLLLIAWGMYDDASRTAKSQEEMWLTLGAARFILWGIVAWLVHRSLVKISTAGGSVPKDAKWLPFFVFIFPGLGMAWYANWRFEARSNRSTLVYQNQSSERG